MSIEAIQDRIRADRETIVNFLREICAIRSDEGRIGPVGERIGAEMQELGFDEVRQDRMGNILGRIGDGPRTLLFDSHIDTVGIGDRDAWEWDPFLGRVENGILYARGACDEKGSTPPMLYGMAAARDLGLLDGWTTYYFGNMEEWCDGIAAHALVEVEGIRPDFVVIGEPTTMKVYRGHKGRVELKVVSKGKSAHAAANELGDNAIYKLLPVLAGIRDMGPSLGEDAFLGKGRITVTDMTVQTPSINAVPDECTIFIDRRVTFGETRDEAVAQVQKLIPEEDRDAVKVEVLHYDDPSYTGFVFEVEKYFPAWALPEEHPLVRAGLEAQRLLFDRQDPPGRWGFSTNGVYWMGEAGIPSIGFGPGDEVHAHTVQEQIRLEEVVNAAGFYAILPGLIK